MKGEVIERYTPNMCVCIYVIILRHVRENCLRKKLVKKLQTSQIRNLGTEPSAELSPHENKLYIIYKEL